MEAKQMLGKGISRVHKQKVRAQSITQALVIVESSLTALLLSY
ncbi:7072_t:CDS:2 [Ambispora gerdemannii]|uniref:7072_t:CDS:1 n=1 Tax=Ambispora gerdemannii TaxID=144530 RepID=A0A9N9A4J8_9GLOM|nr:7072_t:CDS:2 [Ambispora gerdemannii]